MAEVQEGGGFGLGNKFTQAAKKLGDVKSKVNDKVRDTVRDMRENKNSAKTFRKQDVESVTVQDVWDFRQIASAWINDLVSGKKDSMFLKIKTDKALSLLNAELKIFTDEKQQKLPWKSLKGVDDVKALEHYSMMFDVLTFSWCLVHPLVSVSHVPNEPQAKDTIELKGKFVFDYFTRAYYKIDEAVKGQVHQVIYLMNSDVTITQNGSPYEVAHTHTQKNVTLTTNESGRVVGVEYDNSGDTYKLSLTGEWVAANRPQPQTQTQTQEVQSDTGQQVYAKKMTDLKPLVAAFVAKLSQPQQQGGDPIVNPDDVVLTNANGAGFWKDRAAVAEFSELLAMLIEVCVLRQALAISDETLSETIEPLFANSNNEPLKGAFSKDMFVPGMQTLKVLEAFAAFKQSL